VHVRLFAIALRLATDGPAFGLRFGAWLGLAAALALVPVHALGDAPSEAEFVAAQRIGEEVAEWVEELPKIPVSLGVFYVSTHPPLTEDFGNIIEAQVIRGLTAGGVGRVQRCPECRVPTARVEDDRVILTKASPDKETFARFAEKLEVDTFLVLEVHRTALRLRATVTIYQADTAAILSVGTFSVPAMSFSGASTQFLATLGTGRIMTGTSTSTPLVPNLSLLEEVGFAKAGLNIGGILGASDGTLLYVNPTLAFRGYLGRSGIGWAWTIGAGYGFVDSTRGLSGRTAIELFMGSLGVFGIEAMYLYPINGTAPALQSYVGIHAGIALGR
jgi:hypothetical protein